jgi:hypothetical protein
MYGEEKYAPRSATRENDYLRVVVIALAHSEQKMSQQVTTSCISTGEEPYVDG